MTLSRPPTMSVTLSAEPLLSDDELLDPQADSPVASAATAAAAVRVRRFFTAWFSSEVVKRGGRGGTATTAGGGQIPAPVVAELGRQARRRLSTRVRISSAASASTV